MVPEKAGWYPDSDRLGERYWNCEAWDGFRVRNRDLGFVIGLLIWVYFPIAMVWVAEFGPHFRHPSVGLREASAVIGLLTLIPIARALTQAVTITSAGVADRGILRTRRYPLARIEDAFMRETGLGPRLLVLRLGSEKLVTLGDLDSPPEVLRVYLSQIRALLPTAPALDRSLVRPPERQVVARQRAHGARYVPRALRSARVAAIAVDRPGMLLSARVLVHFPRAGSRATDLFDAQANCLGSLIEVNDDSRAHPYGWRVELRDLEERCVAFCTVTDADRSGSFALHAGDDGDEIANIGPRRRVCGRWFTTTREITLRGEPVGHITWNRVRPQIEIEDIEGSIVATATPQLGLAKYAVVHVPAPISDPLCTVAVLARFMMDLPSAPPAH